MAKVYNKIPVAALSAPMRGVNKELQRDRLTEIGLYAPLAIMGALNKEPPKWMRLALLFIGVRSLMVATSDYLEERKKANLPPL